MSKNKVEQNPKDTSTATNFAALFFPSILETQKQRKELKILRAEQAKSHARTLELQRQMHDFLYRM